MKKPYSVGYFSSYDRGLECLLDMWPKVTDKVPEATLDIYYGWDTFDQFHRQNPDKMKWKWQMIRKMHDVGAVDHGRVNHQQLAEAMKEIQVWAYPTEFTEIHCITALKAVEAKMIPITTHVGALKETALCDLGVYADDIYTSPGTQQLFVDQVIHALKNYDKLLSEVKLVKNRYWVDVAQVWDKELK